MTRPAFKDGPGVGLHRWPQGDESRAREQERSDATFTVTTCAWCPDHPGFYGTAGDGRVWSAKHRAMHHPKARDRGQFVRNKQARAAKAL